MERDQIGAWLKASGVVRSACDLDLLLFFTRHAHALLTTEQIANFVGYGLSAVTEALEHLLAADIVTRVRGRAAEVDLYIFDGERRDAAPLASLLDLASTREGRLAVMDLLPKAPGTWRGVPVADQGGAPHTQAD